MLTDFREAVAAFVELNATQLPLPPVYGNIPDDVNELPCIVVGKPLARQTSTAVVFDLALELFVIGRRQQAGDMERELTSAADALWVLFNGTRATHSGGFTLAVRSLFARELTIAGLPHPAYTLTVESSIATC